MTGYLQVSVTDNMVLRKVQDRSRRSDGSLVWGDVVLLGQRYVVLVF